MLPYPDARRSDTVDTLHGVQVPDPYRWLEDPDDPATLAWVEAQNALTRSVLDGPERDTLVRRLTELFDYPRTGVPVKRGARCFFTHNTGLQNQPVVFVQETGAAGSRPILDPNALAPDGTIALTALAPSEDGTLLAYALSHRGSDWQEIRVREVASALDRPDVVRWAKFTAITWRPDASGFYYTRYPEPGTVPAGEEHYFPKVCFHRLGDDPAFDAALYERHGDRELVLSTSITDDGRWVVITVFKGASDKCEVFLADARTHAVAPEPLFGRGFESADLFIDSIGDRLYFRTDHEAPLGRVVAVDVASHDRAFARSRQVIVPETTDKLNNAAVVGGRLVLSFLRNASDRLRLFGADGGAAGEILLPGLGSVTTLSGRPADKELFVGFMSFTAPPTPHRYDFASGRLDAFALGDARLDTSGYRTTQIWYRSKDGTPVSMFLVHRHDLARDGTHPALLSGYGGFNISMTPGFYPSLFAWLERGGIYALANLRGGGEYGESWHQAGMRDRKQNVFDDFIAAAEWLIEQGYTSSRRLAIQGGSNGGLLVAAAMLQRPDLFGAVVCRVPVADMLRYHLFTVGRFWVPEYGSADDPEQFAWLLRYSPYHNIRDGVAYPAALVMTADTDDRVAPGMAKKFAARLQAAARLSPDPSAGPCLIRVETRAGHGAGKPVTKMIEEDADIYTFLFQALSFDRVPAPEPALL